MVPPEYATLPSKARLERLTVLRRVVAFLCSEETGDWSFASLSVALDIPEERLRKEFGTEEALLETAVQLLPDVLFAAVAEPLRTAWTGREAVHRMLEIAVSLRKAHRQLRDPYAAVRLPGTERKSDEQRNSNWDKLLGYQIQDRFERSVYEGELPESANVRSMSALTLALLNGLLFCTKDEASDVTLLESVSLFVDRLGFHVVQPSKRRPRRLAPVLPFVRRSSRDVFRS